MAKTVPFANVIGDLMRKRMWVFVTCMFHMLSLFRQHEFQATKQSVSRPRANVTKHQCKGTTNVTSKAIRTKSLKAEQRLDAAWTAKLARLSAPRQQVDLENKIRTETLYKEGLSARRKAAEMFEQEAKQKALHKAVAEAAEKARRTYYGRDARCTTIGEKPYYLAAG